MAGVSNFPTGLDDSASLGDVTDNVTPIQAAHHNNMRASIEALELKVGVYASADADSLDFRLGNATAGHSHDGASGQGPPISPSSVLAGDEAVGGYQTAADHMAAEALHGGGGGVAGYRFAQTFRQGSIPSGGGFAAIPIDPGLGNDQTIIAIYAMLRRPPSGATTVIDVNFGGTSIWHATQAERIMFAPGATKVVKVTGWNATAYQSGAGITFDADVVGSNDPGQDLSLTFVFRDY